MSIELKLGLYIRELDTPTLWGRYLFYHLIDDGSRFPVVITNQAPDGDGILKLAARETSTIPVEVVTDSKWGYIENIEKDFYGTHFIEDIFPFSIEIQRLNLSTCKSIRRYGDTKETLTTPRYIAEIYVNILSLKRDFICVYKKQDFLDAEKFLKWLEV